MRILAQFKQIPEYINFCIAELKSLFTIHGIQPWEIFELESEEQVELIKQKPYLLTRELFPNFPFVYLKPHSEELLKTIISRSLLTKSFVKVISEGNSTEELIKNVDIEKYRDIIESPESFCFMVDTHNRWYQREEQLKIINKFGELPWKGPINLSNPQKTFLVLEDWENDNKLNYKMKKAYFGIQICKGGRGKDAVNAGYELPNRAYLGPTSTDCDLSFIMANQALIKEYDFVLDPFVGTGSLLIPASHFKAVCFGAEIDARVLHGYGVGRLNKKASEELKKERTDVFLNFKQYGFTRPEILRMDSSRQRLHIEHMFDAIMCDPPYGWRAAVRTYGDSENKIKKKAQKKEKQSENEGENNEPSAPEEVKVEQESAPKTEEKPEKSASDDKKDPEEKKSEEWGDYYIGLKVGKTEDVVDGLLTLSDKMLKVGGRLVYLFPIDRYGYENKTVNVFEVLPRHPNFELVEYSENGVGMYKSRILVTMKKIK